MTKKTFEDFIELIINEDEETARELFHELCVQKSREIYESLIEEEDEDYDYEDKEEVEEALDDEEGFGDYEDEEGAVSGEEAEDYIDDVSADEEGMSVEDENPEDLEDRVVDVENELDELKAEFERIIGGEDEDFGDEEGDEFATDEFGDEEGEEGEFDVDDEDDFGGEEEDEFGSEEEDEFEESRGIREYKEKVQTPTGSKEVGTGGSVSHNDRSPTAKPTGKGSIKTGHSEESGRSTPSSGKYGQGMDPRNHGSKLEGTPKPSSSSNAEVGKGGSVAQNNKSVVAKKRGEVK